MSPEDMHQKNYENNVSSEGGKPPIESENEKKKRGFWPWVIGIFVVLLISAVVLMVFSWLFPQSAEDDSWERIKLAGVLRVATSADYPPFSYYNQDFKIDGFDPALIREVGKKLDIEIEIKDYAFESLNSVLQNDQADVAMAAISVSSEREAVVDFSNVYFIGDDGVLARVDSGLAPITDIRQLSGLAVGVQRGSVYEKWAQETLVDSNLIPQNRLYAYSKPEQAVADLKANRLHVVILDRQPAIQFLSDPELVLAGESLNQQRLAIAIPEGAQALQSQINKALQDLQNEGKISQLAQDYLGLRPEDIIPPPTCLDSMTFVRDINFDDENLTAFPEVDPGDAFQKGWQIKNTGTCSWNEETYIKYVRGNKPEAQMEGQPTAISGTVEPGDTYDLYVNLVAPQEAGQFVGYWQMHNSEGVPFGQTIWVAIEVSGTPPDPTEPTEPEPPTPTMTETEMPPEPTETQEPPEPTETEEPTEEPGSELQDIIWVLEEYRFEMDDEELTEPIEDVDVILEFTDQGRVEGNAGCNTYEGRYVTDGIEVIIRDVLASQLSCDVPEGLMAQEEIFLNWLERTEEYRIVLDEEENEHLELFVYIIENDQRTEKVLLIFYDQEDGPPER